MFRVPVALAASLIAILMVSSAALAQSLPPLPGADGITWASLATTTGAVVAAGIIFGIIQVLKGAFPSFVSRVTGAGLAFVLSAILYVLTAIVLLPGNADGYLVIFIAWLNCALVAVGIHATTTTVAVRAGVAALKDPGIAAKVVGAASQSPVKVTQTVESATGVVMTEPEPEAEPEPVVRRTSGPPTGGTF